MFDLLTCLQCSFSRRVGLGGDIAITVNELPSLAYPNGVRDADDDLKNLFCTEPLSRVHFPFSLLEHLLTLHFVATSFHVVFF